MFEYINKIRSILDIIEKEEADNIKKASDMIVESITNKTSIYIFGASHAGILAEEMFFRAGGLIPINPIFGKELILNNEPITTTSRMERLQGYGSVLAQSVDLNEGDILILHSVSGRNPVTIELGLEAKKKGVKVIAITNVKYSKSTTSRDASGKRLFEIADLVLDNHGDIGDAAIQIEEGLNVSATSTVIGATIINSIVELTAKTLKEKNVDPLPFFYSANLDGGDEKNKKVVEEYKNMIHYKF